MASIYEELKHHVGTYSNFHCGTTKKADGSIRTTCIASLPDGQVKNYSIPENRSLIITTSDKKVDIIVSPRLSRVKLSGEIHMIDNPVTGEVKLLVE